MGFFTKTEIPSSADDALPGRDTPMQINPKHAVLGTDMCPPFPDGMQQLQVGMGCFWGAERLFWQLPGVYTTAVGYSGGYTPNPGYEEVCSGRTGHTEAVLIVYDPGVTALATLLKVFWENHDPTQGMRQGNDRGTQYRSAIYVDNEQDEAVALTLRDSIAVSLQEAGFGEVTTEIKRNQPFYYAETYHQQYLHKNPMGYCGIKGTGVQCTI